MLLTSGLYEVNNLNSFRIMNSNTITIANLDQSQTHTIHTHTHTFPAATEAEVPAHVNDHQMFSLFLQQLNSNVCLGDEQTNAIVLIPQVKSVTV